MPGGESERDGGALVVTVQAAVLDREVHVPVHAAARWTSQVSIMTGVGACITIPNIYCFQRQNIQEIERKIITKT
jgi:hypothetical protein